MFKPYQIFKPLAKLILDDGTSVDIENYIVRSDFSTFGIELTIVVPPEELPKLLVKNNDKQE